MAGLRPDTGRANERVGLMAASLHILGIRHHGPGSARTVLRALEALKPDAVLIEGPPDAAEVLALAGDEAMKPPVALLVYEPENPSEAAYYPFATFSPEWQAIRWALSHKAEVRFIDLPQSMRPRRHDGALDPELDVDAATAPGSGKPPAAEPAQSSRLNPSPRSDPLDELAIAAGFADGEAWWGRVIEERRGDESPMGVFDAIGEAMGCARKELGHTPHDLLEPAREAHMRKAIRLAIREGYATIAVVCGAWHAPVLGPDALKAIAPKADDEILKELADRMKAGGKRKTAATWIPWTYDRLAFSSGYGAGIHSPGWYEHVWAHPGHISEHWLTRVARLMRREGLDASPASIIETVRLADSLATLRGRAVASLEELSEATLSVLCHGNPLPMKVIARDLIVGHNLGEVPDEAPAVPLQRDLTALQKSLRMKVSAEELPLDLDQRKETDLARSRLLHRLTILQVDWGTIEHDQRQRTSTFHELWKLQWKPELVVRLMEAARWGNTVHDAAAACVADRARQATSLAHLTTMLDHVMLADLPSAVEKLVGRIQQLSAVSADVGHLMEALPPLARVLRYGNVRKTDAALVEPVVAGLLARICVGLLPACGSLDDDAAGDMKGRMDEVNGSLLTLDRPDFAEQWRQTLAKVGDADIHGLVAGRAWRILLDAAGGDQATSEQAAERLSLALSRGNDPVKASAWLEGFIGGSGMVLVHDARLLAIVDQWVASLSRETFEQVCPIARRTFATFAKPERRQIGEKLKRGGLPQGGGSAGAVGAVGGRTIVDDDYEPSRGTLVDPVLRLILGEAMP